MKSAQIMPVLIKPCWPAPPNVRAFVSTRSLDMEMASDIETASIAECESGCGSKRDGDFAGVSVTDHYAAFNLAQHVGDAALEVEANREALRCVLGEPTLRLHWLDQCHSTDIVRFTAVNSAHSAKADAAITDEQAQVCAVLTADCLPVLICDRFGTEVASVHAGWRGLANGILSAVVACFSAPPDALICYLGPAISQSAFQVGEDVRDAFCQAYLQRAYAEDVRESFMADPSNTFSGDKKYFADLYRLARSELNGAGLTDIYGGDFCTYTDGDRFYSFRRNNVTGRMATGIWLAPL